MLESTSEHVARLSDSYEAVGSRTWVAEDFVEANLAMSRDLYTPESLVARRPRPKPLEVFALVAGLPFPSDFVDKLAETQQAVSEVLGSRLQYWVKPDNLGVEFAVFKWPTDSWDVKRLSVIETVLSSIHQPAFRFEIGGVQINPDGCVVAKGFDADGTLFRIRDQLKSDVPSLPARQSGWAHVPLGRILEPLGKDRFARLRALIADRAHAPIASTEIDSMKLIHETRWYMEERTVLAEYTLDAR